MRSKSYCIQTAPVAWKRVVRREKKIYDSYNKYIVSFGLYLNQQHNEEPLFTKPIHIDATFYMPITNKLLKSLPHSNPPHLDNLYKFLFHCMKDVLFTDERIICSLSIKKVYDKEPRTELVITEVL